MDKLETGDLLLFHDRPGACFSLMCMVKTCTASDYSHTAIVVKDPDFVDPPLKGLYILESSGFEKERDAVDHVYKFGVELISLEERLKNYEGITYYRKVSTLRDDAFYRRFAIAYQESKGAIYDVNPVDWLEAKLRCFCFHTQRKKMFWCSALVAFVYTKLGLLPGDTPWSLVWPKDLGSEPMANSVLWQNCTIEREKEL